MTYTFDDLKYLMSRLRDPKTGCPWDIQQTEKTIINYSIEEIYELLDAIERDDKKDIQSELGDVLFQVVFLSQLAKEKNDFDLDAVIDTLCDKLISRHPHVFADGKLYATSTHAKASVQSQDVAIQWESIKAQERKQKSQTALFDDIPHTLPSLVRANKIQKRAAAQGFDWPSVTGAVEKLEEEIIEFKQALSTMQLEGKSVASQMSLLEELGDIFFSTVNVARHVQVNPEESLRYSSRKFIQRLEKVQELSKSQGESLSRLSLGELDDLWQQAKTALKEPAK